jgi:hypothetical protein
LWGFIGTSIVPKMYCICGWGIIIIIVLPSMYKAMPYSKSVYFDHVKILAAYNYIINHVYIFELSRVQQQK